MNKLDYDKRIKDYEKALEWYANASTCDLVKLHFGIADSTIKTSPEIFARWVKVNEDISEIWQNGTDEHRKKIDEVIARVDKKYKRGAK